jgi:hypothetical protein
VTGRLGTPGRPVSADEREELTAGRCIEPGRRRPDERRQALESRPGWHRRGDGLARELRRSDFPCARGLAERLADEATYSTTPA